MVVTRHTHAAFHATGRRLGELAPVAGLDLRPLLAARYRDLTTIRYDFPLVLVPDDGDGSVKSLSGIMDELIAALAETDAAARIASDVVKIEMEIRALVAHGHRGSLATLWDAADGKPLRRLPGHAGRVIAVAFSRDGRLLATGSFDGTARLWVVDPK